MAKKKNLAAQMLGRIGGRKRAEKLTKKRRKEIAQKAGVASGKARAKKPPQ
jgi:general stress protein YciG